MNRGTGTLVLLGFHLYMRLSPYVQQRPESHLGGPLHNVGLELGAGLAELPTLWLQFLVTLEVTRVSGRTRAQVDMDCSSDWGGPVIHFQKQTLVWGIHGCLAVRNKSHWKAFFCELVLDCSTAGGREPRGLCHGALGTLLEKEDEPGVWNREKWVVPA